MTGMNTLGSTSISDHQNRTVTIEVTGVRQQSVMKTGYYQVRVPYSQMSQALQTINHQGGKVESVQLGNSPAVRTSVADDRAEADAGARTAPNSEEKKSARRSRQR